MTANNRSELWQRLRAARAQAKKTQADVAKALGISRPAIALWESKDPGHRTTPSTSHLNVLAEICGVSVSWLLDDASDPNDVMRPGATERPADVLAQTMATVSTASAASFWSAVRYGAQARLPQLADCFDVKVRGTPPELGVVAPFLRAGNLVFPAALQTSVIDALRREAPQLVFTGRAVGRNTKMHLLLWSPTPGAALPADLAAAMQEIWGVSVVLFASIDQAADYLLNL